MHTALWAQPLLYNRHAIVHGYTVGETALLGDIVAALVLIRDSPITILISLSVKMLGSWMTTHTSPIAPILSQVLKSRLKEYFTFNLLFGKTSV